MGPRTQRLGWNSFAETERGEKMPVFCLFSLKIQDVCLLFRHLGSRSKILIWNDLLLILQPRKVRIFWTGGWGPGGDTDGAHPGVSAGGARLHCESEGGNSAQVRCERPWKGWLSRAELEAYLAGGGCIRDSQLSYDRSALHWPGWLPTHSAEKRGMDGARKSTGKAKMI